MSCQKPNILWLCADQQRYNTIGALGNPYIDTPNLDKLCENGVAFTHAYCQNPVCTPSRASFLTGKYPSSINANMLGAVNNPEYCTLITKALADAGYHCGNIGKLHISTAWGGHEYRCDDGYAEFHYNLGSGHDLGHPENEYWAWLQEKGVDPKNIFTNDGRDYSWYREDAPIELRQTAWCAETAIDFMRRNADKPWLLSVNCFDPHPPYDAPTHLLEKYLSRNIPDPIFNESDYELNEKLWDVYHQSKHVIYPPNDDIRRKLASYYGMCEIVDMHFGRIIDALEDLGLAENTIVIFTSDHGEMVGDHGLIQKGCRFYDSAVRVPLIISCPAKFHSGRQVSAITELTDIAPTIAELAGIDYPDVHGRSLLPALMDCGRAFEPRQFARCEYYNSCKGPADGKPTYGTMFRDQKYKLVTYHGVEYGELYDMEADPREEHNLWEDPNYTQLRYELMKKSFDATVIFSRPKQERIGRY